MDNMHTDVRIEKVTPGCVFPPVSISLVHALFHSSVI